MGVNMKWKMILILILLWMLLLDSPTSIVKFPFIKGKPHDFHYGYYWQLPDNSVFKCHDQWLHELLQRRRNSSRDGKPAFPASAIKKKTKPKQNHKTKPWIEGLVQFVKVWIRTGTTGWGSHGVPSLYVIYNTREHGSVQPQHCLLFKFSVLLSHIAEFE